MIETRMEQKPPGQVAIPSAEVKQPVWNSTQAEESLGARGARSEPLGRAAMGACMCNLREVASREGLLEADEDRPVITREGEKFNVPEELVKWLRSDSRRCRDLTERRRAWRMLADLLWKQESRIKELLKMCAEDGQNCSDVTCHERLEARLKQLDKLWEIASEQHMHAILLSKDPVDGPYTSFRYSA